MHRRSSSALRARLLHVGSALLVGLLCGCSRNPAAPDRAGSPEGRPLSVRSSGTPDISATPTRVIVRLAGGVSGRDFAAAYGASLIGSIPELQIQLLGLPQGQSDQAFITRLEADARVLFAEKNLGARVGESRQSTVAFSEAVSSWSVVTDQHALERVGARQAHHWSRGDGVLVAIVDTGVDLHHPALSSRLVLPGVESGQSASPGDDRAEGVDSNADGLVDGALGHGTHVAGIIAAVAPGARILPVRVLDSDGVGYAFAITHGLVAAVQRGAAVVNMSLGMPCASQAVAAAIELAHAAGVVVVAPAGNSGVLSVEFPAAHESAVAVAATDDRDRKATFSNCGPGTDVAAPGVGILSTYVGGGYASWSGTSMAAPFVSGVAALLYGLTGSRGETAAFSVEQALARGAVPLEASDPLNAAHLGSGRASAAGSVLAWVTAMGIVDPRTGFLIYEP